VFNNWA